MPVDTSGTEDGAPAALRVLHALRRVTTETDRYVQRVGSAHGSGPTDLAAVAALLEAAERSQEHSPGSLARDLGLSSPATSAMLDRLERAGHVRRVRSATDRRRVVVEATGSAQDLGRAVFGPMAVELASVLAGYTPAELSLLERFLDEAAAAVARRPDGPHGAPG
ncbi:MarR family transcriptional regulator [Pseudokineococcus basanitobsidens]|uniref:MarR family transcriptional regulator n=1 Tax=Pseudokineococcus basanitobsidens TaxID=1926649 RepID=A0ABU8RG78_9ACTN